MQRCGMPAADVCFASGLSSYTYHLQSSLASPMVMVLLGTRMQVRPPSQFNRKSRYALPGSCNYLILGQYLLSFT
jgi:hypothetical protein